MSATPGDSFVANELLSSHALSKAEQNENLASFWKGKDSLPLMQAFVEDVAENGSINSSCY